MCRVDLPSGLGTEYLLVSHASRGALRPRRWLSSAPLPRRERDVAELEDGDLQREGAEVRDQTSDQPAVGAVLGVAVAVL